MSAIRDAAEAMETALKTVEGIRVYRDLGANVDPPAAILSPPALSWEALCVEPTSARFLVYVAVAADDRAVEKLWDLVPPVAEAVDKHTDASVISANPGVYGTGGSDLPCYELTVEYPLT